MNGREIVQAEAKRILTGMVPLAVLTSIAFALSGYISMRVIVSVFVGTVYSFLLFLMIGNSAVKAATFPPAQAISHIRRGYLIRYLLTGVLVVLVLKTSLLNPAAAILPLFFPKIILLVTSIFLKKGG